MCLYFLCCSVNGYVCLVCCVFDSICELFGVILLLSVGGGALLDRPCIVFQRMCVCCACDSSVHLDVPSIDFVYVFFVCRK